MVDEIERRADFYSEHFEHVTRSSVDQIVEVFAQRGLAAFPDSAKT